MSKSMSVPAMLVAVGVEFAPTPVPHCTFAIVSWRPRGRGLAVAQVADPAVGRRIEAENDIAVAVGAANDPARRTDPA
jgi:hypothetical protein